MARLPGPPEVRLGRNIGFDDLEEKDVQKLLQSDGEELMLENLVELRKSEEVEEESTEDLLQQCHLIINRLAHFYTLADELAQEAVVMDPSLERS